MKFFLISDNIDTQMGMRLAGIEGVVVHERQEVLEVLEKVLHRSHTDDDPSGGNVPGSDQ